MAPQDVEQFTRWEYDPASQAFILPGAPESSAVGIDVLTEGHIYQRGSNLHNANTGRFVGRLSTVHPASLEVGNRGTVLLNNRVPLRTILDPRAAVALPRLEITGGLEALGGEISAEVSRTVSLSGRSEVVYVNDQIASGKAKYSRFPKAIFGDQGPPLTNEFGRLAQPEDLVKRSIAGWLARNASTLLERAKVGGFTLPDGTVTTQGSEIVKALAASITVAPIITYVLREGL